MKILVTGSAGFIGFHLVKKLMEKGYEVTGIDNINEYYDVNLKYARLENTGIEISDISYNTSLKSKKYNNYNFIKLNLEDKENILQLFSKYHFDSVCHLAAQAGVRYSLQNPYTYLESNLFGFLNILEACRYNEIKHLVYASSSSVYGLNEKMPFSVRDNVDHPISLYAASKKANELMAHTYSHLFSIPTTGLRFFTVYGPWGRPDMALFKFTRAILSGESIEVYNNGDMSRDFTYIDDISEGVMNVINNIPTGNADWDGSNPDPSSSPSPYKIYNIGNNSPVKLMDFIKAIEEETGIKAKINFLPLQPGDVRSTWADVNELIKDIHFRPNTDFRTGIKKFISWFREFYKF